MTHRQVAGTSEIVRNSAGYVLPIGEQPWFAGASTPEDLIHAWEEADHEDWVRFDALLKKQREAMAEVGTPARRFLPVVAVYAGGLAILAAGGLAIGACLALADWVLFR
jgi:hypothetical protein